LQQQQQKMICVDQTCCQRPSRPRLSRQILEACRLDSKLAQISLEFSMRVKGFAWVAQRVGLEQRKNVSNISVVTAKVERG
jgi:hypothetical protein